MTLYMECSGIFLNVPVFCHSMFCCLSYFNSHIATTILIHFLVINTTVCKQILQRNCFTDWRQHMKGLKYGWWHWMLFLGWLVSINSYFSIFIHTSSDSFNHIRKVRPFKECYFYFIDKVLFVVIIHSYI